ncbi:integrase family protein [Sphingobium chlorophenolicum L-1]|uniref:Integrase family protein n=1 Tax=Sphingobium chlorophenolicum L-1 TaxID=690566 RepID=F6F2I2_SPHCR|nr:site-specific integrase [Sphingobium chlorophenolicum]AEG50644.1 integrase family protein [Sphingobium chlorophenolicum L-1]
MAGTIEGAKKMTSIQYVSRKEGTYYFRRIIRLGDDKPFRLRLSLRTMNYRQAKALAPALAMACEVMRKRLMTSMGRDGLSAAQRAEIFKRQMLRERDRIEAGHAQLQLMDLGGELAIDALNFRLDAGEAVSRDLADNGDKGQFLFVRMPDDSAPDDEDHPIEIMTWEDFAGSLAADDPNDAVADHLGALGIEATALNRQMALRVVHQAAVEALREYKRNLENPGAAFPPVPVTGADLPVPSLPAWATGGPSRGGTQPPVALQSPWATMTASQAAAAFIDANPRTGGHDGNARKKGSSWTEKTREQFKLPALLLEQVMTGRPLATVTDFDLVQLDKCFNNLHGPSFRKSPRQREMTIQQIVEETAAAVRKREIAQDTIGLGIGTTNRHWGFLRQLTNWFQRHHSIADLDYTAFIIDDDRDPRLLCDTYSVDEGRLLFSLPPWTGCASEKRRFAPGETIIHDACYFVPMIAWYTGLRREEICGLQLIDIDQEDGLWHFKVQDNDVRTLKTRTSRRLVPFASELVRLRLPEYVEALRIAGETLLFPELAAESGKGTRGDAYYKNHWKKVATRLDFLEPGQAMHAFRHTVTDELKNLSVFEEVRADLVGHKIQSETGGRYSKAARLAPLRAAVDQIPIVTSDLPAPPLALLPAGMRKPRRARAPRRT